MTVSGVSGATAIASGRSGTCALLSGGTVSCWGSPFESFGATPTSVPQLKNVTAIAAGREHLCALLSDGTVVCQGEAITSPDRLWAPAAGVSGATAIATGYWHACALVTGGDVWCWARAGIIPTVPSKIPGLTGVKAIAAAGTFTCALGSDDAVTCIDVPILSMPTPQTYGTPFQVAGLGAVASLGVGNCDRTSWNAGSLRAVSGDTEIDDGACAIGPDGALSWWPLYGSSSADASVALPVTETDASLVDSPGGCAIRTDGSVWCWGFALFPSAITTPDPVEILGN
jgi:hypothetical protein